MSRTENAELSRSKPNTDSEELQRRMLRRDKDAPRFVKLKTAMAEPSRLTLLNDSVDPSFTKSTTESDEPNRTMLRIDREELKIVKPSTDIWMPKSCVCP